LIDDRAWREVWDALAPTFCSQDNLLVPCGAWPEAKVQSMRQYTDSIDILDANILFLHKARLSSLPRKDLERVCNEWNLVFGNDVFVCLARDIVQPTKEQLGEYRKHFKPVQHYLTPSAYRRCAQTVYFVHIPKTAGTTVWNAITTGVQAKVYYESHNSFVNNPPRANEYDIVGGHVFKSAFERALTPDARIACVLRDPVERFRSAFLHSRRRSEDASTFSPTMKLMRELPLREFLNHPDAKIEANLQLLMLGASPEEMDAEVDSPRSRARAHAAIAETKNIIMTVSQLDAFVTYVRSFLGLHPLERSLPRLNSLNTADQQSDLAEFASYADCVRVMAAAEYDLFHRVVETQKRFLSLQQVRFRRSALAAPWQAFRRLMRPPLP